MGTETRDLELVASLKADGVVAGTRAIEGAAKSVAGAVEDIGDKADAADRALDAFAKVDGPKALAKALGLISYAMEDIAFKMQQVPKGSAAFKELEDKMKALEAAATKAAISQAKVADIKGDIAAGAKIQGDAFTTLRGQVGSLEGMFDKMRETGTGLTKTLGGIGAGVSIFAAGVGGAVATGKQLAEWIDKASDAYGEFQARTEKVGQTIQLVDIALNAATNGHLQVSEAALAGARAYQEYVDRTGDWETGQKKFGAQINEVIAAYSKLTVEAGKSGEQARAWIETMTGLKVPSENMRQISAIAERMGIAVTGQFKESADAGNLFITTNKGLLEATIALEEQAGRKLPAGLELAKAKLEQLTAAQAKAREEWEKTHAFEKLAAEKMENLGGSYLKVGDAVGEWEKKLKQAEDVGMDLNEWARIHAKELDDLREKTLDEGTGLGMMSEKLKEATGVGQRYSSVQKDIKDAQAGLADGAAQFVDDIAKGNRFAGEGTAILLDYARAHKTTTAELASAIEKKLTDTTLTQDERNAYEELLTSAKRLYAQGITTNEQLKTEGRNRADLILELKRHETATTEAKTAVERMKGATQDVTKAAAGYAEQVRAGTSTDRDALKVILDLADAHKLSGSELVKVLKDKLEDKNLTDAQREAIRRLIDVLKELDPRQDKNNTQLKEEIGLRSGATGALREQIGEINRINAALDNLAKQAQRSANGTGEQIRRDDEYIKNVQDRVYPGIQRQIDRQKELAQQTQQSAHVQIQLGDSVTEVSAAMEQTGDVFSSMTSAAIGLAEATEEDIAAFEKFGSTLTGFNEQKFDLAKNAMGQWEDYVANTLKAYKAGLIGLFDLRTQLQGMLDNAWKMFMRSTGDAKKALEEEINLLTKIIADPGARTMEALFDPIDASIAEINKNLERQKEAAGDATAAMSELGDTKGKLEELHRTAGIAADGVAQAADKMRSALRGVTDEATQAALALGLMGAVSQMGPGPKDTEGGMTGGGAAEGGGGGVFGLPGGTGGVFGLPGQITVNLERFKRRP